LAFSDSNRKLTGQSSTQGSQYRFLSKAEQEGIPFEIGSTSSLQVGFDWVCISYRVLRIALGELGLIGFVLGLYWV